MMREKTTISEPPVRSVAAITRAYASNVINADVATLWISQLYAPDEALPICKHGLYSGTLVNGAPACPLCLVDHGYGVER